MAPAGQVTKDFTLARINLVMGAHAAVQRLRPSQPLFLYRDVKDTYDPGHAVMVVAAEPGRKFKIGYLPTGLAKEIAPLLDAGVNVIARKAPNPLYGVCQIAYVPPAVAESEPPAPVQDYDEETGMTAKLLPPGITQADLDESTELPPLGDSRRLKHKESPDDESTADADA